MEEVWFKDKGKVIYDPKRGDMKANTNWWCIIDVDNAIADYYRNLTNISVVNPFRQPKCDLNLPSWGAHVSVIRGEKPKKDYEHLWKKYHGLEVEFEYSNQVRYSSVKKNHLTGGYWFVEVRCSLAKQIRDEFNIPSNWLFHITIGREY